MDLKQGDSDMTKEIDFILNLKSYYYYIDALKTIIFINTKSNKTNNKTNEEDHADITYTHTPRGTTTCNMQYLMITMMLVTRKRNFCYIISLQ